MSAPKGNQFWKLRSKHGRDTLFADGGLLWDACCEYFEWCDENPLYESVVQKRKISRDEEIIELVPNPKKRPYTIYALCAYLGCNTVYFNQLEESLIGKTDEKSKDFSKVIIRIRETIYNQKFEGAVVGMFNATIISRDLGLQDRKDITTNGENISTDSKTAKDIEEIKNRLRNG